MAKMSNVKVKNPKSRGVVGYLQRWFLAGLLVSMPLALTIVIIRFVIEIIDGQVLPLLPDYLHLPGLGVIVAFLGITVIGGITSGFIGRSLIALGERILNALPVVRSVYGAIKQITETVMTSQSDSFREVVLIEYPRKGIWAIGFVTGTTKGEVQNRSSENLINVFVPTTPNPTSGFLLFFNREECITLDMSVEEAVKMVISAGIVTPGDARATSRKKKPLAKQRSAAKAKKKKSRRS